MTCKSGGWIRRKSMTSGRKRRGRSRRRMCRRDVTKPSHVCNSNDSQGDAYRGTPTYDYITPSKPEPLEGRRRKANYCRVPTKANPAFHFSSLATPGTCGDASRMARIIMSRLIRSGSHHKTRSTTLVRHHLTSTARPPRKVCRAIRHDQHTTRDCVVANRRQSRVRSRR
jgi:hypothetical protein